MPCLEILLPPNGGTFVIPAKAGIQACAFAAKFHLQLKNFLGRSSRAQRAFQSPFPIAFSALLFALSFFVTL